MAIPDHYRLHDQWFNLFEYSTCMAADRQASQIAERLCSYGVYIYV